MIADISVPPVEEAGRIKRINICIHPVIFNVSSVSLETENENECPELRYSLSY